MKTENIPYQKQIFICTNDNKGEKPSCADHQGETVFKELRRIAKDRGLHPQIRVAQAKCLGQCAQGVNIMVFPEGTWHTEVRVEDIEKIAEKYLLK